MLPVKEIEFSSLYLIRHISLSTDIVLLCVPKFQAVLYPLKSFQNYVG